MLGSSQLGIFLGLWIMTVFGFSISGAHFNPAVTIAHIYRSGHTKLESPFLALIYIAG
jgi:glycerol uptake facilitator-like aquaporin